MLWVNLPTNHQNISWTGDQKFRLTENQDGTVSVVDVTDYSHKAESNVPASEINKSNEAVNDLMNRRIRIAEPFSTSVSYNIGDYAIYDDQLYRFTAAHVGAWSVSDCEVVSITGIIDSLGSMAEVDDAPSDGKTYGRKNGAWAEAAGGSGGSAEWGGITGTLSDQTDLASALNGKPDEAPNDGIMYGRKQGAWAPISSAGVVEWGDLSGNLSDQADLVSALNEKVSLEAVAVPFYDNVQYAEGEHYVTHDGLLYRFIGPYQGTWENLTKYGVTVLGMIQQTETDVEALEQLMDVKAYQVTIAYPFVADLPYSAGTHYVTYKGRFYYFEGPYQGSWEGLTDKWEITVDELLTALRTAIAGKADASHTHDDRYYTEAETDTLLAGKSDTSHNHDSAYSALGHTHDDRYYTESEIDTLLAGKSDTGHTHDDRYYTESEIDSLLTGKADSADVTDLADDVADLQTAVAGKADTGHTHDDRYYTEAETDALLSGKSDTGHTHDDRYYTESEVDTLLSGKSDTSHNHDSAYSAIGHTHDDRYYTESEMDTKLAGKANSSHTHDDRYYTETEVDTLLGGKANSSHAHGNITSAGAITSNATIASSDRLIIRDNSDSSKLTSSSITFDGSTTTKALTPKGTWETFAASSHTHDDRYYTETEVNNLLAGKEDTISDSDWKTMPNTSSLYTGSIRYRKVGDLVQIVCTSVKLATDLTTNSRVIDTVPSGFRPKYSSLILVQTYINYPTTMMIATNGQITFYKGNGNSTWDTTDSINANGFYFV